MNAAQAGYLYGPPGYCSGSSTQCVLVNINGQSVVLPTGSWLGTISPDMVEGLRRYESIIQNGWDPIFDGDPCVIVSQNASGKWVGTVNTDAGPKLCTDTLHGTWVATGSSWRVNPLDGSVTTIQPWGSCQQMAVAGTIMGGVGKLMVEGAGIATVASGGTATPVTAGMAAAGGVLAIGGTIMGVSGAVCMVVQHYW